MDNFLKNVDISLDKHRFIYHLIVSRQLIILQRLFLSLSRYKISHPIVAQSEFMIKKKKINELMFVFL